MRSSSKITTAILGLIILIPGLAKFTEPFKTFIYKHLELIGFPLPKFMQYIVALSEIGIGLTMLYLAFKANNLSATLRNKVFYLANLTIIFMMVIAVYTHLHPKVPEAILPLGYKPPLMPVSYILLVHLNVYLYLKPEI